MSIEGNGLLLRIFIGESDRWEGRPLYEAIVLKAREMGMAGATVFRGIMGFGSHSRIHTTKVLRLSDDLPVVIEIADKEEKVKDFLAHANAMVPEGMIILEDVNIMAYRHKPEEA